MGRKPKYSKEIKIQACKDYEESNLSFNDIGKNLGTTKGVILQWYLTYKEHVERMGVIHQIDIF